MDQVFMPIKPYSLNKGDSIALVAPASWVDEIESIKIALEKKGYPVHLASNIGKKFRNFSGTDKERAQGIMDCFIDPKIKGIWALRGGYGSGRILPYLDYEVIANNPKIFIGMSDITALHIAMNQCSHLVTFLGPVATSLFSDNNANLFAEQEVWATIRGLRKEWDLGDTFIGGVGEGKLVGGNLALIVSLIGTPYEIDTEGNILVLEDIGEYTYRIDRLLVQMQQAGLFDKVHGVILGSWKDCKSIKKGDSNIDETLNDFFKGAKFPILKNFPTGHITNQVTLPLNCLVQLDGDQKKLKLLESAITLR